MTERALKEACVFSALMFGAVVLLHWTGIAPI